jgi:AcrR family transcriptional regulator
VLLEGVLALAAERDFSSITIRDLTDMVDVNRTTFYVHFRNKDDLIAQALDMLFEEFTSTDRPFVEANYYPEQATVPPPVEMIFRHIQARPELYRRLLGATGSTAFSTRLADYYEENYVRIWESRQNRHVEPAPDSPPAVLRARMAVSCMLGLIRWWLNGGLTESVETVARWQWEATRDLWFENIVETDRPLALSHPSQP